MERKDVNPDELGDYFEGDIMAINGIKRILMPLILIIIHSVAYSFTIMVLICQYMYNSRNLLYNIFLLSRI